MLNSSGTSNKICRFLFQRMRKRRNVPNNIMTFIELLLLLVGECSASLPIIEGAPSTSSSLTALDPINTRPTRVDAEEADSHTYPPQPLPLQLYAPPHAVAAPLLQDISRRGRRALQVQVDVKGDLNLTTGSFSDQRPHPSSTSLPSLSSSLFPHTRLPSASQRNSLHQSPYSYHYSTSVRLLKASPLRHSDAKTMPSPHVMKDHLSSRKKFRVTSGSNQLSTLSPNKDSTKSKKTKKSFHLYPLHPPSFPVPPRPTSSPPPLVPLWIDLPSSSKPFLKEIPLSPPPTVSEVVQSSTISFINLSNSPEGRKKTVSKDDYSKVREKNYKIPGILKDDPVKLLSSRSASIGYMRSNGHYWRKDNNFYFLRKSKFLYQDRLQPVSRATGYPQYQQHMDEQNYPEPPRFHYDLEHAPEESLKPNKEIKASKNTPELHSNEINSTTALDSLPKNPLQYWANQQTRNPPNQQSLDEEETLAEYSGSELNGMQSTEDSTRDKQEKTRQKKMKELEKEDRRNGANDEGVFWTAKNNQRQRKLGLKYYPSYNHKSGKDKHSNKQMGVITDITNVSNLIEEDYDNETIDRIDEMTTEMQQKVNLQKLEMELSKKDQEAASDLLLAISILQHHIIPSLQKEDEYMTFPKKRNSSKAFDGSRKNLPDYSSSDKKETRWDQNHYHPYNIEILDGQPSSEADLVNDEDEEGREHKGAFSSKENAQGKSNETVRIPPVHEVPMKPEHQSCYRWFVLVLDGNCSVIKQRMSAFVTFLKAALSSKLSIDYNDVYVPSVFCDNTFMVNISLDTIKNPQAEIKLRLMAEANTTLLEISEEIFYLEKILTKRSDDGQDLQPLVKKPDDVELVIYIAVGCMCVFILLSVVIVALIRVCRQEGDQMDIGKTIPHQSLPRSFDFPIRRPNVIYSHRYDTQFAGELLIGDDEFYCLGSPIEDPFNDRRSLVSNRRRATKVPGEDVIMEEDIVEEDEEDLEDDDEDDDDVEEEPEDDKSVEKNKMTDVQQDRMQLGAMEGSKENGEHCHFHISETMKTKESRVFTKDKMEIRAGINGRIEKSGSCKNVGASFVSVNSKVDTKSECKSRVRFTNLSKSSEVRVTGESGREKMSDNTSNTSNTAGISAIGPSTTNKARDTKEEENTNSGRAVKAGIRAKELLGSRLRGRRNLRPGYEVVFTGIDNPCYNR
ncbi:uncharacterized protein [Palaemon carinicauda]|uniref:uncharacterized protein isoform X2 n=1 Tax=Palaemon carinicauda TaxID=392227 RepID=UPI0035B5E586